MSSTLAIWMTALSQLRTRILQVEAAPGPALPRRQNDVRSVGVQRALAQRHEEPAQIIRWTRRQ